MLRRRKTAAETPSPSTDPTLVRSNGAEGRPRDEIIKAIHTERNRPQIPVLWSQICLCRRESLSKVLEALLMGQTAAMSFDTAMHSGSMQTDMRLKTLVYLFTWR